MLALPPIGTTIVFAGRIYRFCGTTPASVQPPVALLQDLSTGTWTEVPASYFAAEDSLARQ
jgi:hypothetical protein